MTPALFKPALAAAALGVLVSAGAVDVRAETLDRTTIESRVILGFKADDAKVAALMPNGWIPVTLPQGPLKGVNFLLVMMDRQLLLNAEGKPETPASDHAAATLVYARKDGVDGVRAFVTHVFETPPMVNNYGNSVAAHISRAGSVSGGGGEPVRRAESWTLALDDGSKFTFDLDYVAGTAGWSTGVESRPYSNVNPDVYEIYRYDQLADLAMNTALGRALNGEMTLSSEGILAEPLDGTEDLVAIIVIPVYERQVFRP